ncbi:hypothetical protein HMI54_010976 [Coelomomyces lativittatus]|nr:hypothetical protein HMI54_010976 [Coelomomyces lativittatus]
MIDRVPGHGSGFPNHITFANHLDYKNLNNHQRYESTYAVFDVMDSTFSLKNIS